MKNKIIMFLVVIIIILGCAKTTELMFNIDSESCSGCGDCLQNCPYDAIEIINNKAVIDQSKCKQCGDCVVVCPEGAIY